MIVFTATNKETRDVYVGTARESVEEEWADLNAQAENGVAGQFFQQLRAQGTTGFEVDTWAYGESASEARASMREAREELGAQSIKSSRSQAVVRKPASDHSDSMKALMAVFQEAMTDTDSAEDEDSFDTAAADKGQTTEQGTVKASPEALTDSVTASGTLGSTQAKEASAASEEERMKSRVEAMKVAQAKLLRERGQQPTVTSKKASAKSGSTASAKIASGRTGSSAKEKRIREAIEAERERRESVRQTRGRDEYDEMSAVMARVEMRRLATKRSKAEKTKAEAAKKRKLEREKKAQAAAVASASTLSVSVKADSAPTVNSESAALIAKALGGESAPAKKAKAAAPAAATKASRAAAKAKVAELKLAVGRTGSSVKEKRIKEAIEQEKADRQSKNSSQSAAEAEEMAAILARLDERGKVADKFKRSR